MDGFQTHVTVRTCLGFLLLILLQTSTEAQLCVVPAYVEFPENNENGTVVTDFTIGTGVTAELSTSGDGDLFRIEGNSLIATASFDRETTEFLRVEIICFVPAGNREVNPLILYLINVNDEPPEFAQDPYEISVNELTPVDTSVSRITATDVDSPTLYYTLKPEPSPFKLQSPTNPILLVATPLEYHKTKNVLLTLEVQDTQVGSLEQTYYNSTTINVTIKDIDNRQPWFQPCEELDVEGVVMCQSPGYTGMVVLNKQEPGPLELKPGPLFAIDGDSGINEAITYSIVSGDGTNLFAINEDTGEITMQRATDVLGNIVLTVRASQKLDIYQFAITTVTISVQEESFHLPKFENTVYEGVVAEAGDMVMDLNNRTEPLQIIATDEDYSAVGGANPHITYNIPGSNDFRIIEGYLFMIRNLPEGTLSMQVDALDKTNDQRAIAELVVKVESGLTTTTSPATTTTTKAPLGTTSNTATTTKGGSVPDGTTTSHIPPSPLTTPSKTTTTNPSGPTGGSVAPTKPSQTSQGGVTTTGTAQPYTGPATTTGPQGSTGSTATGGSSNTEGGNTASTASPSTEKPSGGYERSDMLALGITLGVLLLICLVIIILLVCYIKKRKQDWEKIYETAVFRSSLGNGSKKDGIQYINTAFQNDYVEEKLGSHGSEEQSKKTDGGLPVYETVLKSSVLLPDILPDNISQASSNKSEDEKEVKPILTKERKSEDGYKAVWFKEDIDPDAKEEVVIIPDSRENYSEAEDEDAQSSSREEDEDDSPQTRTPRVLFKDIDLDEEIESKTGDQTDSSEDDEEPSVDL